VWNCNYIRVIIFLFVFLLSLAPSVHDPVVQAKMQAIDDEELAAIEAEAGLTIGLNVTAYAVATSASLGDSAGEFIILPQLYLYGNGNPANGFTMATNLGLDVGSSSAGRAAVYLTNLAMPYGNYGISLLSRNVNIIESSGNRTLGNIDILNAFMGRNVTTIGATAITPALANVTDSWLGVASRASGGGLDLLGRTAMYIDSIHYKASPAAANSGLTVNGIYIYSPSSTAGGLSQTPSAWLADMKGDAYLGGGPFPTYWVNGAARSNVTTTMTIDAGASGTDYRLKLALPMAATIKVRDFSFDGFTSFGPIMIDNIILYRQDIVLRNL
jgi:hypothetical protein